MPASLIRNIYRGWSRKESFWDTLGMNENLKFIGDHLPGLKVIGIDLDEVPTTAPQCSAILNSETGEYSVYSMNANTSKSGWTKYQPAKGLFCVYEGDIYTNNGSAWVKYEPELTFIQDGVGAVERTVLDKMRERITLKDFGAVGDGVSDDTQAVLKARDFIESTGKNVTLTYGVYLCDPFTINAQAYALQGSFVGEDRDRCVFKRKTNGPTPFITIGSVSGTSFQAGFNFSNIKVDGGDTSNGDAFVGYDLVRSSFVNCIFNGGKTACQLFGGISVSFKDCTFSHGQIGLAVNSFASSAGGGWPNLIRFVGGEVVENTNGGIYFDGGRMLVLDGIDVEGNGTTKGVSVGGVYIGQDIGSEVSINDTISIGVIINNCWFEANRGVADLNMDSGQNSVTDSNFFSQSSMVENDIRIGGGKYSLTNLNMSFAKPQNILELSNVASGNLITKVEAANIVWDESKTTIVSGQLIAALGGQAPFVIGKSKPIIQTGVDATSVNPSISFARPFKAGTAPVVLCQVVNDGLPTIDSPEIYSVSNTGFTVRKKSFNGTAITTSNYTVNWVAFGESE